MEKIALNNFQLNQLASQDLKLSQVFYRTVPCDKLPALMLKEGLDCSQPAIFSYLYSIVARANKIARTLDASTKRRLDWVGGGDRDI